MTLPQWIWSMMRLCFNWEEFGLKLGMARGVWLSWRVRVLWSLDCFRFMMDGGRGYGPKQHSSLRSDALIMFGRGLPGMMHFSVFWVWVDQLGSSICWKVPGGGCPSIDSLLGPRLSVLLFFFFETTKGARTSKTKPRNKMKKMDKWRPQVKNQETTNWIIDYYALQLPVLFGSPKELLQKLPESIASWKLLFSLPPKTGSCCSVFLGSFSVAGYELKTLQLADSTLAVGLPSPGEKDFLVTFRIL